MGAFSATQLHNVGPGHHAFGIRGRKGDALTGHRSSSVQSVERAISILRSFSLEKPERGVGELGRELGLHKSTVSRLMMTLERGGLLSRNPVSKRYRLGIDFLGLAAQVAANIDVREAARPILRRLAEACQESVNLSVLDIPPQGADRLAQVVNLEQFVPPKHQIKNIGWVGRRMAPHCTAAGKVLLASLPAWQLDLTLPAELDQFTKNTITDPHELCEALRSVAQQGYAVAWEELEDGLNAVAVPVCDHTGAVVAALGVAGPAYRVTRQSLLHLVSLLSGAATEVSERLGYRAGAPG